MIHRIVVPTDGYGLEDHVIRYVARAFPFAEFHVISVINPHERGIQLTGLLYEEIQKNAQKAVKRGKVILEKEGIHGIKTIILEGQPEKKIISYAKEIRADLIALRVYSRKSSITPQRLGSTVKSILENCPIPVLTLAEECERIPIKKVLFATDGTRTSEGAKDFALQFASSLGARLEVLHVVPEEKSHHRGETIFKNVEWFGKMMELEVKRLLEYGDEVETILKHAKRNDVVIIGSGRKFLFWHYLGHVAQAVCTHSPVPVIVVFSLKRGQKRRWTLRR